MTFKIVFILQIRLLKLLLITLESATGVFFLPSTRE